MITGSNGFLDKISTGSALNPVFGLSSSGRQTFCQYHQDCVNERLIGSQIRVEESSIKATCSSLAVTLLKYRRQKNRVASLAFSGRLLSVLGDFFFFGVFWSYLQNVGIVPLAACVNYLTDSTFIDLSSSSEWCSIGGRCGQRWVTFRLYPPLNESEKTAMLEMAMCFRAAHAVFNSIINNQSKSNGDEFQSMLIESWDEALKSNGRRRQRWTRRWHATDVGDLINATESSDGDIQRIRHWANVSAVAFDTTCFNSASLGTNDVFDDASMASFHHKLKHQSSLLIKKKAVRTAGTNPSGGDSPSSQRRHRVSFKTFSSSAAISQHFNNDILLTIQVIEFILSLFNRLPLLSRWISVISKLVDSVNFHLLNTALVNQLTALKSKQIIRLNQNQTSPHEYVEFS